MKLQNEYLSIEIAEHGAELIRILDKKTNEERLWNADPAYWKRSAPVLFPNVGKVYGGVMHTDRGDFSLGQHGFARDMEFKCVSRDEKSAVYELSADENSLTKYPYNFVLRIGYELKDHDIIINWHVENRGEGEMPFTIGGHPAFVFEKDDKSKDGHYVYIPGLKQLTFKLLDPEYGCALKEEKTIILEDGYLPLNEELFANDALICDGNQINEAWLCGKDKKPIIGVRAEGFPNFGIWSVKDAPFVCLEPWQGRCDDVGFTGLYGEKPNSIVLKQNEVFDLMHSIVTA